MSENASSPLRENSDGYKPQIIPNALKVIKNTKNIPFKQAMKVQSERSSQMLDQTIITGITAIFIPVPDIQKAKEWYEKYLELKWNGFCLVVPSGPPIFLTESEDQWELQAVSFKVKDAHGLYKNLETHGIRVQAMREIPGIGKEFDFYDPFGNKLQATQPPC